MEGDYDKTDICTGKGNILARPNKKTDVHSVPFRGIYRAYGREGLEIIDSYRDAAMHALHNFEEDERKLWSPYEDKGDLITIPAFPEKQLSRT